MSAIGMGTTQGKTFLSGVSRHCFVLNGSGVHILCHLMLTLVLLPCFLFRVRPCWSNLHHRLGRDNTNGYTGRGSLG
jgi:hypothetical protein